MAEWLTPLVAVVLMYTGVLPSLTTVYLLYEDRRKPGVLWFLVLMTTAGVWALLYATFTLVRSPGLTLALANVFWAAVPTAGVATFLLAYEYVFRTVASKLLVLALFVPVAVLFVLSWFNPGNVVFTPAYHVGADGVLYVPPLGGPLKILVTKVYGYFLTVFAAGMFVGEVLRTTGVRRRQTFYLLFILMALTATTLVKIVGLVPEYFDPTSMAYSVSGLLFAYSIDKHGLLKFEPVAREQAFQTVDELIFVVDPDGVVLDVNRAGRELLGEEPVGKPFAEVLPSPSDDLYGDGIPTVELEGPDETRYFSWHTSPISYGRAVTGELVILSDITTLKRRQNELQLLKQILTRVFRHNMRNDLNVIEGYASVIRNEHEGEPATMAEKIQNRSSRLLEEAEKAKALETIFEHREPTCRSLREEVDQVLDTCALRSDTVVQSTVDDVSVEIHPLFGTALEELLANAIAHHDSPERAEITITSTVTDTDAVLRITDDGPGIPAQEIAVLDAREETNLQHSSGIGLWLVNLIVTRLGGELAIDSDADGTCVEIRLARCVPDGQAD